jgi:adenylosuccinate synthase
LDVLSGLRTVQVVDQYEIDGAAVTDFPEDVRMLESVRPMEMSFAGWQTPTGADGSLVPEVRDFVRALEDAVGVPVVLASVGPDREATHVLAENPFTEGGPVWPGSGGRREDPLRT